MTLLLFIPSKKVVRHSKEGFELNEMKTCFLHFENKRQKFKWSLFDYFAPVTLIQAVACLSNKNLFSENVR